MKKEPTSIDTKQSFSMYRPKETKHDLFYDYFHHDSGVFIDKDIDDFFRNDLQFEVYNSLLNIDSIVSVVKKYFAPNDEIWKLVEDITKKYSIEYDNTCVVFYRGNDKITETNVGIPTDFAKQTQEIAKQFPGVKFLVQSDETNFIELMQKCIKESIVFYDEIRHMHKNTRKSVDMVGFDNYKYSKMFLAIMLIMAKCKYLICNSGNNPMWIYFFRHIYNKNNARNVTQSCNGVWY
jgi:hypothetical protein